jgi:hypothetical protein
MTAASDPHREFVDRAHPHEWLRVADDLHCQAVAIKRMRRGRTMKQDGDGKLLGQWDIGNRVVFLLAGFALENAIKAFLVYENPGWISNGTLARPLRSHALTSLQAKAKRIPFKGQFRWVLTEFESGLESWARYPCALTASESEDERVLTERLWRGYLRVMKAYGRRLVDLLGRPWPGAPHGYDGRWQFRGVLPLADE